MNLIEYQNTIEFLRDIYPFIENNFISHYLLFETTDRLIHRSEAIQYCCTIKNKLNIEVIYIQTNRGFYFYGNTKSKLAVNHLSERISREQFFSDVQLQGSTFIIENFIKDKHLNFRNIRHRYYMSLKSFILENQILKGNLLMANEKDYDTLISLMLDFYNEEFEGKGVQTVEQISSSFKEALQSDGIYYWKLENHITTIISTAILPGHKIYIPNIYTSPMYRNKGISKIALGTLLTELFDSGNIEIGLNVKVSNKAAIGLFSSLGMKKIYETGIYEK